MEKGFNGLLFDGWHNWSSSVGKAIVGLVMCLISIIHAIIFGLVSLLVYVCVKIKRFAETYPVTVLMMICAILLCCLLFLFVSYSAKLKTCQIERDSIAYEKTKLEQAFVGDTIIIRGYSTHTTEIQTIEE